jgi:carotenoid cleavage dioxygenase-like enzyme
VAIVTGSGERDGWLMATGIDMGFITSNRLIVSTETPEAAAKAD